LVRPFVPVLLLMAAIGCARAPVATDPAVAEPAVPVAADYAVPAAAYARINEIRAKHGLSPVSPDRRLVAAARRHARDMVRNDFVGHIGSDGTRTGQRADAAGYVWRSIAENVAAGPPDALAVITMWMNSPGHRHNLLDRKAVHAGLAHVARDAGSSGARYENYWVLVLAAPISDVRQPGATRRP